MSLSSLHIELLKTINKTPGCKSYEQLISENGDKMIYDTYLYLKEHEYLTQNIVAHFTMQKKVHFTKINTYSCSDKDERERKNPVLTEIGLDAIKSKN